MSDQKKPTDDAADPAKELDADQLENVAGGLLPAVSEGVFKFFRPSPTGDGVQIEIASHKIIADEGIVKK
jgi:hypothetical protein